MSDPTDPPIGVHLRRLRTQRGWSQETLAERAGVSVDVVKKLERRVRHSARLATLTAFARALDVPCWSLLGGCEHVAEPASPGKAP